MDKLKKEFASKLLKVKAIKLQPKRSFHLGFRLEVSFLL